MNKVVLGIIISIVALVSIGGVIALSNSSNDDGASTQSGASTSQRKEQSSSEVQSGTVNMDIVDFDFAQETLRITPGTTVVWTNQDDARHDVTPDEASPNFMGSELLAKGETYSFTFQEVGSYSYFCTPHPYMKGTIEVVAQ